MTARPDPHPTKAQLQAMNSVELAVYIANLRQALTWRRGPAHKDCSKRLEVALKVHELRLTNEQAGDV